MEILFRTIHGSRLYGLHHSGSDHDFYTVIPTRRRAKKHYAKHKIVEGLDSNVVDFGTFVDYCNNGVPQALEAMFSPCAEIDYIRDFRHSYRINTPAVVGRYKRTIKSFSLADKDRIKRRRHALRLLLNLTDLLEYGRFNPTLTTGQAHMITTLSRLDGWLYHHYLDRMMP